MLKTHHLLYSYTIAMLGLKMLFTVIQLVLTWKSEQRLALAQHYYSFNKKKLAMKNADQFTSCP